MTPIDPDIAGGTGTIFVWLAEQVLGGAQRALGWAWKKKQWADAQDAYDAAIIEQYGQVQIFGQSAPKSLRDIFTDVYVLDKPTAFRRFSTESLAAHLWQEDRGLPFRHSERQSGEQLLTQGSKFIILGKPGAGKTTFLKRLAVCEAQRGKWGKSLGKVPIFVSLRQFAQSGKALLDFIVDQFAVCHFPDAAPFVKQLLTSGKALLLFDGLDEVTTAADAQADRRAHVTEILDNFSRTFSDCHIVITCRNAASEYTFASFSFRELSDFAPDQVDRFVRNWFWDKSDPDNSAALTASMLTELTQPDHAGIRDLSRNPLLLTLLCLNYAETLSFPPRRVEIYEEALDALLKKWDSSRQIKHRSMYHTLSLGRKRQMFARIAYEAFVRNQIVFSQVELEAYIKDFLQPLPEKLDPLDIDGASILREIIAQHGIFTEQATGLFSFAHLTFQEYYAAAYIADNAAAGTLQALVAHVTDGKWREVFLLVASLLPDATMFLSLFEQTLQTLAGTCPRAAMWLCQVDTAARVSRAGYRLAATRLLFACISAKESRTHQESSNSARVSVQQIRTGHRNPQLDDQRTDRRAMFVALFTALNQTSGLYHGLDPALDLDHRIATVITDAQDGHATLAMHESLLALCVENGSTSLHEAVAKLHVPVATAKKHSWRRYGVAMATCIESSGCLDAYRLLESEAAALAQEQLKRLLLDGEAAAMLTTLVGATRLFYDCLQLAYVPDRRAFEDRIFQPPPESASDVAPPDTTGATEPGDFLTVSDPGMPKT